MAKKPLPSPLPADLPEDWALNQVVSPNGIEAGLDEKHGYNYQGKQINAAQKGINALNEGMGTKADVDPVTNKVVAEQMPPYQGPLKDAPIKAVPMDADSLAMVDSQDGGKSKRVLWSKVKATLKAYFDGLYSAVTHSHAWSAITGKPSAFTPAAHAASHRTGGVDALTAGDVGALPTTGGTMSGGLTIGAMSGAPRLTGLDGVLTISSDAPKEIKGVANPTYSYAAANKQYVDEKVAGAGGKRTCRFVVGTSTAGWTAKDCDYLCDGTADQVEINAAIQALPATGGEVVILDGTYNITATIAMNKDNVKLSGNGNSTILERKWESVDNAGVVSFTCSNSSLLNCFIELFGNSYGFYSSGISFNTANYNLIEKVKIASSYGLGTYIYGGSIGNKIVNTIQYDIIIEDGPCSIIASNSVSSRIRIESTSCIVSGNKTLKIEVDSRGENGIILGNHCKSITVGGDNFTVCENICIEGGIGISLRGSKCSVTGNNCYNCTTGIEISGKFNTVNSNVFMRGAGNASDYTSLQHTIFMTTSGVKPTKNLITNNIILGKNYTNSGGDGNEFVNNKYN